MVLPYSVAATILVIERMTGCQIQSAEASIGESLLYLSIMSLGAFVLLVAIRCWSAIGSQMISDRTERIECICVIGIIIGMSVVYVCVTQSKYPYRLVYSMLLIAYVLLTHMLLFWGATRLSMQLLECSRRRLALFAHLGAMSFALSSACLVWGSVQVALSVSMPLLVTQTMNAISLWGPFVASVASIAVGLVWSFSATSAPSPGTPPRTN